MSVDFPSSLAARFGRTLDHLSRFEPSPHLAVALSGGADSLALTYLVSAWVQRRGGRLTALTFDHGLRAESGAEAQTVARWMSEIGVDHHILTLDDPGRPGGTQGGIRPSSDIQGGIQAWARDARYHAMDQWCRDAGVLHLLTAHTQNDQWETVAMRASRGGTIGLAGMSAVRTLSACQLLRPLLNIERGELQAYLRGLGQPWVEDPSNQNPAFERVRLRVSGVEPPQDLAGTQAWRQAFERNLAKALAQIVKLSPLGWAEFDLVCWREFEPDLREAVLARVILCVGGRPYPPTQARLKGLSAHLLTGKSTQKTLGGCRILDIGSERLLICREARNLPTVLTVPAGETGPQHPKVCQLWDGRFTIFLKDFSGNKLILGSVKDLWRRTDLGPSRLWPWVPTAARDSMPLILNDKDEVMWPEADARLAGLDQKGQATKADGGAVPRMDVRFRPRNSLAPSLFQVVI